ncbi:MAG: hypothetical protein J5I91_03570 [Bacteroidetes bacterium]|nr:hypothetical protein [Bacteroidota bacterium]
MRKFSRRLISVRLAELIIPIIGTLLFFTSCKKRDVEIPSYLRIEKFDFTTFLPTQGNASQNITDGHVYVNSKYIGAYELPVTIPVLANGKCNVSVIPGIRENGSSVNRKSIKILKSYETEVVLNPTEIDTIHPTTTYRSNTFFAWIEDFESGTYSTEASSKNTTQDSVQIVDSSDVNSFKSRFSKYSAMIKIPATKDRVFFEQYSKEKFVVPNKGADVYLELDYKSNIELQIGFYADKTSSYEQIPFLILAPSKEWKKIYMNLSIETSVLESNTPIQIFYGFLKPEGEVAFSPELYIDNIKLSYLN